MNLGPVGPPDHRESTGGAPTPWGLGVRTERETRRPWSDPSRLSRRDVGSPVEQGSGTLGGSTYLPRGELPSPSSPHWGPGTTTEWNDPTDELISGVLTWSGTTGVWTSIPGCSVHKLLRDVSQGPDVVPGVVVGRLDHHTPLPPEGTTIGGRWGHPRPPGTLPP